MGANRARGGVSDQEERVLYFFCWCILSSMHCHVTLPAPVAFRYIRCTSIFLVATTTYLHRVALHHPLLGHVEILSDTLYRRKHVGIFPFFHFAANLIARLEFHQQVRGVQILQDEFLVHWFEIVQMLNELLRWNVTRHQVSGRWRQVVVVVGFWAVARGPRAG